MSVDTPTIDLCRLLGVETTYVDNSGVQREPPAATLVNLLAALGYPAAKRDEAEASIERLRRQSVARLIEPTIVLRNDDASTGAVLTGRASMGDRRLHWRIRTEAGGIVVGEARFADLAPLEQLIVDGVTHERRHLPLPTSLPLGYHRLHIEFGERGEEGALIAAPGRAYEPPQLERGRGIWGLAIQLYALRSQRNWGIGDLTDLVELLRSAAAAGTAAVSLNPLHALFPDDPQAASPYSPSSRLFLNPLYLDVEGIEDFAEWEGGGTSLESEDWKAALQRSRSEELVDYPGVAERKLPILEQLARSFRARHVAVDDARARAFRAYKAREGPALRRFATFCALREGLSSTETRWHSWRDWPAELRDPASTAVARFATERAERIEFHEYLQWQIDCQLARCAALAEQAGMPVGLYRDLAVGVDANGADAWADQDAIVSGWSIGAPPDPWNLKGQSWGLPPFNPVALRSREYRPLAETLRANMRHAGALRIDHILGFRRLFWIPAGGLPAEGAYVRYPIDDMFGVLALESHRNRCLIVGEDLGTVPEGLRDKLANAGILSYRLMYFERQPEGEFREPQAYPRQALVAVTTHDLPTLPAYWGADDIALKHRLGFYASDEDRKLDEDRRRRDRLLLVEALRRAGLVQGDEAGGADAPPFEAVYRFLARTPSRLLMVQLEDALGIREQVNLPGTVFEHPNWRRRLPLPFGDLLRDPRVRRLLQALNEERPAAAPRRRR